MFKAAIILLALSSCLPDQGGKQYEDIRESDLCLKGCPISEGIEVDHGILLLSINKETKFADWVAYKVKKANLNGKGKSRNWKADPRLEEGVAIKPSDYKDAYKACSYDRGHQAPLAAFSNHQYFGITKYLSNITPQRSDLNGGLGLD